VPGAVEYSDLVEIMDGGQQTLLLCMMVYSVYDWYSEK
jgi:hypothetical protein